MKKILISTLCCFWVSIVFAQLSEIVWQNAFFLNSDDEISQENTYAMLIPGESIFNIADSSLITVGIRRNLDSYIYLVLQKIDKWGNTIDFNTVKGEFGHCMGKSIVSDSSGGYWIAGVGKGGGGEVIGVSDVHHDIWLVHIDSNLDLIGQIRYEDEFEQGMEEQLIRTKDGGYLLTYSHQTDTIECPQYVDVQVYKYDEQFNVEWEQSMGDQFLYGFKYQDYVLDVIQTGDGGFICVGTTYSNSQDSTISAKDRIWVFKLNIDGEIEWERIYPDLGSGCGYQIKELAGGQYLICGRTFCSACPDAIENGLYGEAFLLEIDELGNEVGHKFFGGYYADSFLEMEMLPNGHILLTGQTNSEDGDLLGMQERGGFDIWIVDCFSNWEICSQWRLGGLGEDMPRDLHILGNEEFILMSKTNSNDEWLGDVLNNPNENSINWTVKIGERVEDALSVKEQEVGIVFFPNPTSDIVHAKVPFSLIGAKYNVINAQGQWIQSSLFTSSDAVVDLSGLPSGLYSIAIPQRGWSKSILKEK